MTINDLWTILRENEIDSSLVQINDSITDDVFFLTKTMINTMLDIVKEALLLNRKAYLLKRIISNNQ